MNAPDQLQNGLYNAIVASAPIMAAVEGVYDNPQQVADPDNNDNFPFITIGQVRIDQWDTDTERGADVLVIINVWSRASHAMEAKEIQGLIYDALDRGTITVSGYTVLTCNQNFSQVERDPDGITRHGVQEFRLLIQEDI